MLNSSRFLLNNRYLCKITTGTDNGNVAQILRQKSYGAAETLPLPHNIDATESTRFSPQRTRDISANAIISHQSQSAILQEQQVEQSIDITADNTKGNIGFGRSPQDPHVQSYDCQNPVRLNAVMQTSVPQPFGGTHKFSHLNMPGGQWSQEGKFTAQNLQNSHLTALRDATRAVYQNKVLNGLLHSINYHQHVQRCLYSNTSSSSSKTKNATENSDKHDDIVTSTTTSAAVTISKKEQLKRAFKEYGATIVVFHVAISLVSLGGFYALISSGIDVLNVLEYLGFSSSTLSNKVATGASTFVIAYAVHKVFAPIRISITLGATPFIVRYLRAKGILISKNIKKQ